MLIKKMYFIERNYIIKQLCTINRLSRQTNFKYDRSVRSSSNSKNKQQTQNIILQSNQLEYKHLLFKENNKSLQNLLSHEQNRVSFQSPQSKAKFEKIGSQKQKINTNIGNFYSPSNKQKQINSLDQQSDSLLYDQKSPRSSNFGNASPILKKYPLKNLNSSFENKLIVQVDLYNDNSHLSPSNNFENPNIQNPDFQHYYRSNNYESQNMENPDIQYHSRSKTEIQTKSTSPSKQSDKPEDYQIKMKEIENEQKELEMKQNILQQYKELLQHKIEFKDKKSLPKPKKSQKHQQEIYEEKNEKQKNYSISDQGYNSSRESEQFEISPKNKNKKQITWSLNETNKLQKSSSQKIINNLTQDNIYNDKTNHTSKNSRPQSEKRNNSVNKKQKILFSDLIQKMKDEKEGNFNQNQYKPSIPYVLINKITENDRYRKKNANNNDQEQIQKKQTKASKQEGRKNNQSPNNNNNFLKVRQQFMQKCGQNKQVKQMNDNYTQPESYLSTENNFKQNKPLNYQNLQVQTPKQQNFIYDNRMQQEIYMQNQIQYQPQQQNNLTEIKTSSTVSFNSIKDENIELQQSNNYTNYQTQQQKQYLNQQKNLQKKDHENFNQMMVNNYSNYTIYSNPVKTNGDDQDSEKILMNNSQINGNNIYKNYSLNSITQNNKTQQRNAQQEAQQFQGLKTEQQPNQQNKSQTNYIKQMIDQKYSTQNEFNLNKTSQFSYKDFSELEGDSQNNIQSLQKINSNIPLNRVLSDQEDMKQIQHSSSCKNININNKSPNKITPNNQTFHMYHEQNTNQQNHLQNIKLNNKNQKTDLQNSPKHKVIIQPEMKINQGMLSARGIAGEKPIIKQEKQINLQNKFKEVQFQIDKLIYDTLGESEYKEYNQFETQRQSEIKSTKQQSNREFNDQNEKIELLQFQLDESLLMNQENKVKKKQLQGKDSSSDFNARSQIWMYNKEKNIKKQQEEKSKKELSGCTFKPKLFTKQDLSECISPLKFSVSTQQDFQKLNFQDIESPIHHLEKSLTRDDFSSINEKISIMTKSPMENPSIFSTYNNNNKSAVNTNFLVKNAQNLKENKQKLTYQMINFKKRGSLHKLD